MALLLYARAAAISPPLLVATAVGSVHLWTGLKGRGPNATTSSLFRMRDLRETIAAQKPPASVHGALLIKVHERFYFFFLSATVGFPWPVAMATLK